MTSKVCISFLSFVRSPAIRSQMNFTLFDLLVVIGISQGLFTGYLLLSAKQDRSRNRLLAVIIFTFILLSCKILLHTLGLWHTHTFRYFPLAVDLTIQPLVYLFIRLSVNPNDRFKAKDLLHFFPFTIFLLHAVVIYANVQGTTIMAEKDRIANALHFNDVKSWEDFLSVLSAWVYGALSYRRIKNYRKWLNDNTADMTYPTYTWLRNALILFAFLMLILSVNLILDARGFGSYNFFHWQLFYLVMAVNIYYMGIQGYRQQSYPIAVVFKKETVAPASVSYEEESIARAKEKILNALDNEKAYRDPEISLVKLSEKIGLSTNIVSYVINNVIGKNFRNMVNDYRIAEVKTKMLDPDFRHLSILGIALECGFNSESSFYRIFKKATGMSPKEFMQKH
jgi:AraC-like DNA-binding protein